MFWFFPPFFGSFLLLPATDFIRSDVCCYFSVILPLLDSLEMFCIKASLADEQHEIKLWSSSWWDDAFDDPLMVTLNLIGAKSVCWEALQRPNTNFHCNQHRFDIVTHRSHFNWNPPLTLVSNSRVGFYSSLRRRSIYECYSVDY